jgi:hypothetical protein
LEGCPHCADVPIPKKRDNYSKIPTSSNSVKINVQTIFNAFEHKFETLDKEFLARIGLSLKNNI